jgi:malate dehydrogenase (quinone)
VTPTNLGPMLDVARTQLSLVRYLIGQLRLSEADRVDALREFVPSAVDSDWSLSVAGQRVQVIRPGGGLRGTLEFGTTVIAAADGSLAGLLGASPGATTAIPAMLDVMERCFGTQFATTWRPRLLEMIPSLGTQLSDEPALFREVWDWGTRVLGLQQQAVG